MRKTSIYVKEVREKICPIQGVPLGWWDVREFEKFEHIPLSLKFHCSTENKTRLVLVSLRPPQRQPVAARG